MIALMVFGTKYSSQFKDRGNYRKYATNKRVEDRIERDVLGINLK